MLSPYGEIAISPLGRILLSGSDFKVRPAVNPEYLYLIRQADARRSLSSANTSRPTVITKDQAYPVPRSGVETSPKRWSRNKKNLLAELAEGFENTVSPLGLEPRTP